MPPCSPQIAPCPFLAVLFEEHSIDDVFEEIPFKRPVYLSRGLQLTIALGATVIIVSSLLLFYHWHSFPLPQSTQPSLSSLSGNN